MRKDRRLVGAVVLSVLLHGLLLSWLAPPVTAPKKPVVLDLVLEQVQAATPEEIEAPLPPVEPAPSEPALVKPREIPEPEPLVSVAPPEPAIEPQDQEALQPPELEHQSPRMLLNLERPVGWDDIVESIPGPDTALPFNPGLEAQVRERRSEKRRQGLLASRGAATYGASDQQYQRSVGIGDEIKVDGSCYVLVENRSVEEGARWWPSQCTDSKRRPIDLDPVEFDAIGRMVVD